MEAFYDYLGEDFDLNTLTIDQLKSYRMILTDVEGSPARTYGVFRSLIFDAKPQGEAVLYHLNEGGWYKAEKSFVAKLKTYLDTKCEATDLCPYNHDGVKDGKAVYSEGNYNAARSEEHTSELQSLIRISYAAFCSKKTKTLHHNTHKDQ